MITSVEGKIVRLHCKNRNWEHQILLPQTLLVS